MKTGKLRALGVTTAKRNAALPDVPTVGETVPGYEASVFYGVAGPKGMPAEVVEILNKAFNEALADPKIQKRMADLGGEPTPMTPAQFGKLVVRRDREVGARWSRPPIFRSSKARADHRAAGGTAACALRMTIRPRGDLPQRAADLGPRQ